MPSAYFSRQTSFAAAHRLYRDDLSPAENLRLYGPCTHEFGHGHNYRLTVTLQGEIDPRTGLVGDPRALEEGMHERVHRPFDHRHLNRDVTELAGVNPTAENLVVVIWRSLAPRLPAGALYEVHLQETENNAAFYRGETPASEKAMSTVANPTASGAARRTFPDAIVYLTRRATFSAAHRMHRPDWSDERNREVFGKCANPQGHGHNYELAVTLRGQIDPETDLVLNLTVLKDLLEQHVLGPMDHRNLSTEVEAMRGINPTTENLAVVIWGLLEARLPRGLLYEVKVQETENNAAIYRG